MRWIVILLAIVLAGCATHVPRPDQVHQVPPDRLHAFQTPVADGGTVVVTRDAGVVGSGCYIAVFVDGKQAAELSPGERASFQLPAGEFILGAWNTGKALCSYRAGKDRREVSVHLQPGESKRYRIITSLDAGMLLEPTTL